MAVDDPMNLQTEDTLTLHSSLQALNSCFHFVFFGALDDDDDEFECNASCKTPRTLENELDELQRFKGIFLNSKSENENSPSLTFPQVTKIMHCQQPETWDCGLTCIQMVIRWIRGVDSMHSKDLDAADLLDNDEPVYRYGGTSPLTTQEIVQKHWLVKTIETESIWTIDLVMILESILHPRLPIMGANTNNNSTVYNGEKDFLSDEQSESVSYLFCSRNMGVDQSYKGLKYYKRSFRKDERRVKKLFTQAHANHLPMTRISNLKLDFVVNMVQKENVIAMVLIDNNVLRRCDVEPELDWDGTFFYDPSYMTFSGHYVLLCGISTEKTDLDRALCDDTDVDTGYCMILKNPGSPEATDFVHPTLFERSWKAKGTDNDIVFIHTNL